MRGLPRATLGEGSPAELGSADEKGAATDSLWGHATPILPGTCECVPLLQLWDWKPGEVKGHS